MALRLDLLPDQPKTQAKSDNGKESTMYTGAGKGQINFAALPDQPEPIDIPALRSGKVAIGMLDAGSFESTTPVGGKKIQVLYPSRVTDFGSGNIVKDKEGNALIVEGPDDDGLYISELKPTERTPEQEKVY